MDYAKFYIKLYSSLGQRYNIVGTTKQMIINCCGLFQHILVPIQHNILLTSL